MAEILIADDDRLNLVLACKILEREGYVVRHTGSGEEAIAMAIQSPPDLIVLDIMMPGMGGISVLGQLRQEKTTSHIPVIALTALVMSGDKQRLLACGFDAYVSKPVNLQTFIRRVQTLLEQHTP